MQWQPFHISISKEECKTIYRFIKKNLPALKPVFDVQEEMGDMYTILESNYAKVAQTFYDARAFNVAELMYRTLVVESITFLRDFHDGVPDVVIEYSAKLADCLVHQLKLGSVAQFTEIETLLVQVSDHYHETLRLDNPSTIKSIMKLAFYYQYIGKLKDAMSQYDKIIKLTHPETDYVTLGLNLIDLGNQLYETNEVVSAKVYYYYAHDIIREHGLSVRFRDYLCHNARVAMGFV